MQVKSGVISNFFLLISIPGFLLAGVHSCNRGEGYDSLHNSKVTILYEGSDGVLGPNWDMGAKFMVFLPLIYYDEDGAITGILAKDWECSADYRKWTFHLRTDVRWHDSVPVTAHDVEFSLNLFAHPDVLYDDVWYDLDSIAVVDDSTIILIHSTAKYVDNWGWATYYPKHLLENLDSKEFWKWEFWNQPVGDGPYRYVSHVTNTMVELEANPDYFAGKPQIEHVVLKFSPQPSLPELFSGNVNVLYNVKLADISKIKSDPRYNIHYAHWDFVWWSVIHWNHRNPLFSEITVRRALTHAVNRNELYSALNLPGDFPVVDVPFKTRQLRAGNIPEPLVYDPGLARRLLEDAGWHDEDGDGVREKNGLEFRFEALVEPGSEEYAAVFVQDNLRRVGIAMEIKMLDRSTINRLIKNGKFDVVFRDFFNGKGGNSGYVALFGEDSFFGYKNPRVVQLLTDMHLAVDPLAEDKVFEELMDIISEEIPLTFLFPRVIAIAADRRIKGLKDPYYASPAIVMEHLWIEEEKE